MKRKWKLWPRKYKYIYIDIISWLGVALVIAVLIFRAKKGTEGAFSGTMLILYVMLAVPLAIVLVGLIRNIMVIKSRRDLMLLKKNLQCYDGTVSDIERITVSSVGKGKLDNNQEGVFNVYKVIVDYFDEDGRKRIAVSEEYGEFLHALLKDDKAKVYASKDGKIRMVDDLSWRQSCKDGYIDIPGEGIWPKGIYYWLVRCEGIIAILIMVIIYSSMIKILLSLK